MAVTDQSARPVRHRRAKKGPLRRAPVQERSAARVQRMLDACAEILEEVGYEGLSTTLLAEQAGVAIGSVYQFFPDKRAVAQALAQRNFDEYLARLGRRFSESGFSHWWNIVDISIDEYVEMHRCTPGFKVLQFGDVVDRHLLASPQTNDTVIAEAFVKMVGDHYGIRPGRRLKLASLIAVTTADALITLAFRDDPCGDATVIAEAKTIIHSYLSRVLDP